MGHFSPPGSGSGLRIRNQGPHWIRIQTGSGFTTLLLVVASLPFIQRLTFWGVVLQKRTVWSLEDVSNLSHLTENIHELNGNRKSLCWPLWEWVVNDLQRTRLAVVWFGSSSTPSPHLPLVSSTVNTQEDWERETTCSRGVGWGEGEGMGAKAYDGEKSLIFYQSFNTLCSWPEKQME